MQEPKRLIKSKIVLVLSRLGFPVNNPIDYEIKSSNYDISLSSNLNFGDFTTNVALIKYVSIGTFTSFDKPNSLLYKTPRELAEKIAEELNKDREVKNFFEKVEVAGPGFINFFLSSKYLENLLLEIEKKGKDYGGSNKKDDQKTMVEFGDPNPFKEIHIGHLRNFCIGESYSCLLETQGKKVIRANYQGDVGLHVAKCLWGVMQGPGTRDQGSGVSVDDLAKGYVLGAKKYEEDEALKKEIQSLNKKIYEMVDGIRQPAEEDEGLKKLWEEGRDVSLQSFEKLYQRIGVSYDKFYFESITAKKGKEIVLQHIDDGVFEKSDGAVVFRGEKEGLHTRVFLTSQNYATYEAKDLALAVIKNDDENSSESVILTGNEQLEYFQVMLAALKKINSEVAKKTKHFTFGHVRLKDGKMSSRTGDVISAQWLLDEAVLRVSKAFPEMDKKTAEKVGVGAVKYSMLKFSISSDIHFSFEESISLEGNSGPYLLYSFVRTQSVIVKSKEGEGSQVVGRRSQDRYFSSEGRSLTTEESELLRFLAQFPYILSQSANEFSPNLLCNYLFDLCQKFNLFYQKHKIIGSENEEFRLQLTKSVGQVLQNGLNILGIETVEKM